jgi:hypothetical protein
MRKLISILGIGLLAVACTAGSSTGSPGPTTQASYKVATASDQLLLRIESGGGLVPPNFLLTNIPLFALYGDGRVISKGPTDSTFPSPLLPNLHQMIVTPAEIQKIMTAADEAGLLGPDARFDATDIFDAGTITFTATVDGKTHTISAYALGYEGVAAEAAAAAARTKLSDFENKMTDLAAFLGREVGDAEAYAAAAMRLFTSTADSAEPAGLTRQVVAWPLSVDPAMAGEATQRPGIRCVLLTGPDLATFLTTARTANLITVWTFGADRYSVMVRPLYPDETGCPAS